MHNNIIRIPHSLSFNTNPSIRSIAISIRQAHRKLVPTIRKPSILGRCLGPRFTVQHTLLIYHDPILQLLERIEESASPWRTAIGSGVCEGVSSLPRTRIRTLLRIESAGEDLETEIGVLADAVERCLDSCVAEVERRSVAGRCGYGVGYIAIGTCDDDFEAVGCGASVFGVGGRHCAVPEYAFDGRGAGAGRVER